MIRDAVISRCGRYRYTLTRIWPTNTSEVRYVPVGATYTAERAMLFVMLNPSTADANVDDPTIRRCIGFAKREGCTALRVVNLFAFRATQPAALYRALHDGIDPIGSDNNACILSAAAISDLIVMAWGGHGAAFEPRVRAVETLLHAFRARWYCLGMTRGRVVSRQPRHPLYVPSNQPLVPYLGSAHVFMPSGIEPGTVVTTPNGVRMRVRVPRTPVPQPTTERKIVL